MDELAAELAMLAEALEQRLRTAGERRAAETLVGATQDTATETGPLEALLVLRSALISTRHLWDQLDADLAIRARHALRRAKTASVEAE